MAAYNEAAVIRGALQSVRSQTVRPGEIIVVDDGSTDDTAAIVCKEFADCRLIRQQNAGPAAARNRAIAEAHGDWIAFLDADDEWLDWKLETQLQCAESDPAVAVWCGNALRFRIAGGRAPSMARPPAQAGILERSRAILPAELLEHNPVATSTVLARKATLEEVGGFDERFRGPEDYDLWLRTTSRFRVIFLDVPLAFYRYLEGRLSTDDETFFPQVVDVIRKAYAPGGALQGKPGRRKSLCYHYLCGSWSAARRGAVPRAVHLFLHSLLIWPFGISGRYRKWPLARTKVLLAMVQGAGRQK